MLIQVSTVQQPPWSIQLEVNTDTSVKQLKALLTSHGIRFQKNSKVLGKFANGMMLTLEDSAQVCRSIFLRDIEVPPLASSSPVQKFLQRNGGENSYPQSQVAPVAPQVGAKAKAASPQVQQKRSWLRIRQQVWKLNQSLPNIAQMTEAGLAVADMMSALSKEAVQQQLDALFNLLAGDHLQVPSGTSGEAPIIECIVKVSRLVCRVVQPILSKRQNEDASLRSFSTFFAVLEEASAIDQVSKLLGSLQYVIWMGHEQRNCNPRKQPVKAIPSSIFFAYAHHAALPPLERRKRSTCRSLAFVDMMLREYGKHLKPWSQSETLRPPVKIWIIGAEDGIEGDLAMTGAFEEAAGFLSGDEERLRIYLFGDVTQPPSPVGTRVKVQLGSKDAEAPDLVFCPRMTAESLLQVLRANRPRLDPHLPSCALAVSCSCCSEAQRIHRLLEQLGTPLLRRLRNLFGSMAGAQNATYDEHGWITVVQGTNCEKIWNDEADQSLQWIDAQVPSNQVSPKDEKSESKSPAVFWGILDLKYDPSLPMDRRVKVLETGDGRSSKFSGYGAAIKENFKADKKLEETLHRAVLVENKKLTHEFFVESGYEHLMPRQMCFLRSYYDSMALDLIQGLELKPPGGPDKACVLKLCNRARGAGCIPIEASDLDLALERLLTLPENTEEWLKEQDEDFPRKCKWGCFEEQIRHWWSNECPVFVAEELCHSAPVVQDGQSFDGTMRVGFSLHRIEEVSAEVARDSDGEEELLSGLDPVSRGDDTSKLVAWPGDEKVGALTIQWLGGYWKLPAEDTSSSDISARIISKARQGTAPVDPRHLHEVYVALGDAVQLVFTNAGLSPQTLLRRYPQMNELGAFIAARLACSMRVRDHNKSNMVLGLAQAHVSKCSPSPCKDFVESYIHRNFGVIDAMMGKKKAAEHLRRAIQVMPTNSTARYLLGMQHLDSEQWTAAIASFEESLQLDPDFKAPWVNMGMAFLRLRQWQRVVEVSDAGIYRHPNAAHCFYNKGLAFFFMALESEQAKLRSDRWQPAPERSQALEAFQDARSNLERSSLWTEKDEQLVQGLLNVESCLSKPLSWDGWKFFAWRP